MLLGGVHDGRKRAVHVHNPKLKLPFHHVAYRGNLARPHLVTLENQNPLHGSHRLPL